MGVKEMDSKGIKEKIERLAEKYLSHYVKMPDSDKISGKKTNGTERRFDAVAETDNPPVKSTAVTKNQPDVRFRQLACGLGIVFMAFVFSGADIGGARPLGIALMCALRAYVPFAFAGVLLASLAAASPVLNIVSASVAFLLRYMISRYLYGKRHPDGLFSESLDLRILSGAGAGLLTGALMMIIGGLSLKSVMLAVLEIITLPLMTVVYSGITEKTKRFTLHYEIAVCGVLFTVVWALDGISIAGISLSAAAAIIITLYISKNGGVLRGAVTGLICSLAYSAVYAPAFAIVGIVSGLLFGKGAAFASSVGCIAGIVYGAGVSGLGSFMSFAPGLILGTAVFAPLAQLNLLPNLLVMQSRTSLPEKEMSSAAISRLRLRAENEKLSAMADSMTGLSEVFYTLSSRLRKPGMFDIRLLCEKTYKRHCESCALNSVCWDKEYISTSDAITKLAENIAGKGSADVEAIPSYMRSRCPHSMKIIGEISTAHAQLLENAARRDRTEVFAMDYEDMARLLNEAGAANEAEYKPDEYLTERVRAAARDMNFYANNIVVFGERRKQLIAGGVDLSNVRLSTGEIRRIFCGATECRLSNPEFDIDDDYTTMTMHSERKFKTSCAKASISKKEERVNGDSAAAFENRDDFFYALICDGMGSGSDAAVTSRITSVFLQKMLGAGNKKGIVLQMLNNFIRNKNLECFSTVDMLEVDLLSGKAGFIKSGAAPSYIMRGGKLFRISSSTLPIGITREINAEEISFDLEDGDIIVMISDGVAQSFEDSIWLAELLSSGCGDELSDIANRILEAAKEKNSQKDDITVAVTQISSLSA